MKLLFDQNLSYKLVRALRGEFPGSAHVRDLGLASADDLTIWDYAKRFGFTIISKDSDFRQRSFVFGPPPKIIWLRVGNCSTQQIVTILQSYVVELSAFESDPEAAFLVIDPSLTRP